MQKVLALNSEIASPPTIAIYKLDLLVEETVPFARTSRLVGLSAAPASLSFVEIGITVDPPHGGDYFGGRWGQRLSLLERD